MGDQTSAYQENHLSFLEYLIILPYKDLERGFLLLSTNLVLSHLL